jgi:hypothetical protein
MLQALTEEEVRNLPSEAQREADFLEQTAGLEEKLADEPRASADDWEYLRQIIAGAMHFVDQVPNMSQESARLYRALQRARVELGDPPEAQ